MIQPTRGAIRALVNKARLLSARINAALDCEAEAEAGELFRERWEIEDELCNIPAVSLAGLIAKASFLNIIEDDEMDDPLGLAESIIDDLRKIDQKHLPAQVT